VHLEPLSAAAPAMQAADFNRSLGASGTRPIELVTSLIETFQPFIGCIWNPVRYWTGFLRAAISTVHWVHLERGVGAVQNRRQRHFNRSLGASGTGVDMASIGDLSVISTVHWVHLERGTPASPRLAPGDFNRSLGASGTGIRPSDPPLDPAFQPFIGCIWNVDLDELASDDDPISTVHWVHLERGGRRHRRTFRHFNRSLGASGTAVPMTSSLELSGFQPFIGCIWNLPFPATEISTSSFQPFIGCIWNVNAGAAGSRDSEFQPFIGCIWNRDHHRPGDVCRVISTVHWVHLELISPPCCDPESHISTVHWVHLEHADGRVL